MGNSAIPREKAEKVVDSKPKLVQCTNLPCAEINPKCVTGILFSNEHDGGAVLKYTVDGVTYVLKKIPAQCERIRQSTMRRIEKESEMLSRLNDKWFVKFQHVYYDSTNIYIRQPLIIGEHLCDWIKTHADDVKRVRRIVVEILRGMQNLEENKLYHLDISSSNILIDNDDHIKIIDYEMMSGPNHERLIYSSCPSPEIEWVNRSWSEDHVAIQTNMSRADVFALGMVLYLALSKKLPFVDLLSTEDYNRRREKLCLFPYYCTSWKPIQLEYPKDKLLESAVNLMLSPQIKDRPSATALIESLSLSCE